MNQAQALKVRDLLHEMGLKAYQQHGVVVIDSVDLDKSPLCQCTKGESMQIRLFKDANINIPADTPERAARLMFEAWSLRKLVENAPNGVFADLTCQAHINGATAEKAFCVKCRCGETYLYIYSNGGLFDIATSQAYIFQYGYTPADVWGILYRGNVKSPTLR